MSETFDDYLWGRRHKLLFGVQRSIRYHSRRRRFFDTWGRITDTISVVFGSTSATAIFQGWHRLGLAAGFTVAFFSAINLAVGTVNASRTHHDLVRRFSELEKRIIANLSPSEEELVGWERTRLDIEMDEPPVLYVLDSICHNEMLRAEGSTDPRVPIAWYQRLFANFFDIRQHTIESPNRQATQQAG
ncbi:MAG: hypothetical protein HQL66_13685 [Magnetococcales bacterium]|nr:hypothetical protein [Magnetococcales bacterium]